MIFTKIDTIGLHQKDVPHAYQASAAGVALTAESKSAFCWIVEKRLVNDFFGEVVKF